MESSSVSKCRALRDPVDTDAKSVKYQQLNGTRLLLLSLICFM
ncbi:Uncharacterised protein [Achromobacter spanius]|nr:hypothetical protein LMG5911_01908 [Achromobacter spanius]SPT37894.1 Uncharacterised protein [Achromobacter denitrificans]VEE55725.1 Uncharacterised protein [Achromobacter spanius]